MFQFIAKKPKSIRTKFDTTRLEQPAVKERFQSQLENSVTSHGPLIGTPTEKWNQFKDMMIESAKLTIGPKKRVHQDWFDENDDEIVKLLSEKRTAFVDWQNDPSSISKKDRFKNLQSKAQRELRQMQDTWWDNKAEEVQHYADSNNSKKLFSALKAVYGPQKPTTTPLLASDGTTLLKDSDSITDRWREHFANLLNRPSTVDTAVLDQIPQKPILAELNLPPTLNEVMKAVKRTSTGRAAGMDNIPAELFKAAGPEAMDAFHNILTSIWEEGAMPEEFRDATVVSLFKNKGSRADCGNYRGISLLSIAGKILARVILDRLISTISEETLPETQCGFRPGRSTVDMVFSVRQVQEKCIEHHLDLYAVFIDLTKAFDTVNREALWHILEKLGCPSKMIHIIRLFHDGMVGSVHTSGGTSAPFTISNGVKQGCVLAPVLFNLFFTCVLNHALCHPSSGVYLRYRLDGSLFNLRRLAASTKTVVKLIQEALFADDCALMAHTESDLQTITERFSEAARLFGLTISISKTEALHQPAPGSTAASPTITIDGSELKTVDQFKYLGSIISADGSLDREIAARISKASQSLGRLRTRVMSNRNVRLSTKIKVYKAVVLSSLLYGCESWTLYRRHMKQLERFHLRSLRSLLGIKWQDRVTNLEVLEQASLVSIEAMILKAQLRWTGHVIRMDSSRLPRQLLYGELTQGTRPVGRPKKRFKDVIKDNLKQCGIAPSELETRAANRTEWRALTRKACNKFEAARRERISSSRDRRKAADPPAVASVFQCPLCPRVCASRIGLTSHTRAHQRKTAQSTSSTTMVN